MKNLVLAAILSIAALGAAQAADFNGTTAFRDGRVPSSEGSYGSQLANQYSTANGG